MRPQMKKEKMTKAVKFLLQKHRKLDDDDSDIKEREEKYIKTVKRQIQKIDKFLEETND